MTVGERIKSIRESKGIAQIDLANATKISKQNIYKYENNIITNIPSDKIELIANYLEVSPSAIMGWEKVNITQYVDNISNAIFKKIHKQVKQSKSKKIYVLSDYEYKHIQKYRDLDSHGKKIVDVVLDEEYNRILSYEDEQENGNEYFIAYYDLPASAGTGAFLHTDTTQKLKVPETPTTSRADFAIRVSGDSMEPKYYDGDILLVENTPDVEIGQIGIFVLNGTGYVKKKGKNGLISLNPKYDPIEPEAFDDCRCIGRVIGKL